MTNDEAGMSKEGRNPKPEGDIRRVPSCFVIGHSLDPSAPGCFVIRPLNQVADVPAPRIFA
jgi:hypothetical protein